ncbi:MAG: dephospho-CoA kinase [Firmicutes bacterium]|nr:dephospho-CoA kinase [Bacillota bacterium]
MRIIGLTGGIGAGKSTVSSYLKERQIPIIDADAIAREITQIGSPILEEIKKLLGEKVFEKDGSLNRKAVAAMIFGDEELLKAYETITTDEVIRRCVTQIDGYRNRLYENGESVPAIIVLDAPLLFESGIQHFTDETWLVDADLEARLVRVGRRDNMDRTAILERMNRQMSTEEKKKLADVLIDNSKDLPWLYSQVDALLERNGYEG